MATSPLSNPLAPVRPQLTPVEPSQNATVQPTVQPTVRDHFERAGEAIRDAVHNAKEGIKQPIERAKERVRTGVVEGVQAYDQPHLNLLNVYETVFVVDDSNTMTASDWQRAKAALLQMLPLATLHNAVGKVDVLLASNQGVRLRTEQEVGNYVLQQLQQSLLSADVSDMARRTLKDRMGKLGQPGFKPLNLVVLSNRMPDHTVQTALVQAAQAAHNADANHPLRVQYSLTRDDAASQMSANDFAGTFAQSNSIDDVVDCGTIPGTPAFADLAVQQLVGKIGTWAVDSVAN